MKLDDVTPDDINEYRTLKGTRTFKRLELYLKERAECSLNDALAHANKGNSNQTIGSVKVYGVYATLLDDFSTLFSSHDNT